MSVRSSVILFVDLQEGLVEAARTQGAPGVRRGALALARFARALAIPCAASGVPAGPQGAPPLLREIAATLPDVPLQVRRTFGAFASAGIERPEGGAGGLVIIAGVLTEGAVLRTAQQFLRDGREVRVVLDACAGMSARTEGAALRQIEAEGGVPTSLPSLATEFVEDLGTPSGQAVMLALRGLLEEQ